MARLYQVVSTYIKLYQVISAVVLFKYINLQLSIPLVVVISHYSHYISAHTHNIYIIYIYTHKYIIYIYIHILYVYIYIYIHITHIFFYAYISNHYVNVIVCICRCIYINIFSNFLTKCLISSWRNFSTESPFRSRSQ